MDLPMLHDEAEAVYVFKWTKFSRDFAAGRYPGDWSGYCILPWPWHTLPFLEGSEDWRYAALFQRRHWIKLEGAYFVERHSRGFFFVLTEMRELL